MEENCSSGQKISTFVFMDFETTGLRDSACRITEMCFLAVNRVDMVEDRVFPRVINKLTLCVDPKKPVSLTSSNITGLFNDNLQHQQPLTSSTVTLLNGFIDHLAKPVCLLAHYGNGFDFCLLNRELKRIHCSLDSSLLCADSLEAFRSLDGLPARYEPLANQNNRTPSKSCETISSSSHPPPLKRKSSTDISSSQEEIHKAPKLCGTADSKVPVPKTSEGVEKVKKRLSFEENGSAESTSVKEGIQDSSGVVSTIANSGRPDVNDITSSTDQFEESSDVHKELKEENPTLNSKASTEESSGKPEFDSQFSGSLDDAVYVEALKDAETRYFEKEGLQEACSDVCNTASESLACSEGTLTPSSSFSPSSALSPATTMLETPISSTAVASPASSVTPSPSSSFTASSSFVPSSAASTTLATPAPSSSTTFSAASCSVTSSAVTTTFATTPSSSSPSVAATTSSSEASDVKKISYKLEEIYFHLFGIKPCQSHTAEGDCITLVHCVKQTPAFLDWVDQNAVLLTSIKPPF